MGTEDCVEIHCPRNVEMQMKRNPCHHHQQGMMRKKMKPKWLDWMIGLLGYASGFVVGVTLGKLYITDKYHEWFVEVFGKRKAKRTAQSTKIQERISHVILLAAACRLFGKMYSVYLGFHILYFLCYE